jgi:hypothetical protein
MTLRAAAAAAVAVALLGAASCGYPTFEFDPSGTGGRSTASASASAAQSSSGSSGGAGGSAASSSSQSTAASSTASGAATSGTGGAPGCPVDHLVISEIRSRGIGGGNDEFIELYNPTELAIPMDDSWSIKVRGSTSLNYSTRWQGQMASSLSIPAHGHFLIAGPAYAQSPAPDVMIPGSITADSASVLLINVGSTVDAVCFAFGVDKVTAVAAFTCEGNPASNAPHDDSVNGMSNLDSSVARNQNGCADIGDNATDFSVTHPAKPESTLSALVP